MNKTEILQVAKPILFSGDMVRAILEGRKTQTRRVFAPQPHIISSNSGCNYLNIPGKGVLFPRVKNAQDPEHPQRHCNKKIGDILYVRETFCHLYDIDGNEQFIEGTGKYYYAADNPDFPYNCFLRDDGTYKDYPAWKPSIFMPKEVARIFLRVTDIRVEKLQDITESDAKAEGIITNDAVKVSSYICWYQELWDTLNAKRGYDWNTNPWVWVYEFERLEESG